VEKVAVLYTEEEAAAAAMNRGHTIIVSKVLAAPGVLILLALVPLEELLMPMAGLVLHANLAQGMAVVERQVMVMVAQVVHQAAEAVAEVVEVSQPQGVPEA